MDDFRKLQRLCVRISSGYGRKDRKWGCPCCMNMSIADIKKFSKRTARRKLKIQLLAYILS